MTIPPGSRGARVNTGGLQVCINSCDWLKQLKPFTTVLAQKTKQFQNSFVAVDSVLFKFFQFHFNCVDSFKWSLTFS